MTQAHASENRQPQGATLPAPAPKPSITVSAACADVSAQVFTGLDPSWQVTVLDPRPEDEKLPLPEGLNAFLASVPGLEAAVAPMDALDRDIFYVRVHTRGLADLQRLYPQLDPALLEATKVQACKDATAR